MLSRRPSAALGTAQDCPMEVLCRLRPSETNSNARSGSRKGAGNHKTPTSEHSSRRKFPALDVPRLFTEAPDALGLDRTCVQALCPNQVLFNSIPLGTPPTFKNGGSGGAAWQGSPSPNSPPTSLTARSRSSLIATTPTPRALSMDRSDVLSATGSLPPPKDFRFTFSDVFPPLTDQHVVYERAALPVVEDVLQGYNGSVLVYGQTGSGKTYTMFGPPVLTSKKGQASRGLSTSTPGSALPAWAGCAPRALEDIFKRIHLTAEEQGETAVQFEVHISFIEVYMERVRDLLSPLPLKPGSEYACPLKVREDVSGGSFYVEGCLTPRVVSMEEAMRLVLAGLKRRMTGQTAMNDTSSRSHCLLSVVVKSVRAGPGGEVRVGRLALVDLAGSEKVSKTKSLGVQLEEAKQINKSLTTLSLVIQALSTNSSHVPFRNSVLTKLLKESLGGNARTSMIVCCSMERENAAETLSSLRFGALATKVVNRAVRNRWLVVDSGRAQRDHVGAEAAQEEDLRLEAAVAARAAHHVAPEVTEVPPTVESADRTSFPAAEAAEAEAEAEAEEAEEYEVLYVRVSRHKSPSPCRPSAPTPPVPQTRDEVTSFIARVLSRGPSSQPPRDEQNAEPVANVADLRPPQGPSLESVATDRAASPPDASETLGLLEPASLAEPPQRWTATEEAEEAHTAADLGAPQIMEAAEATIAAPEKEEEQSDGHLWEAQPRDSDRCAIPAVVPIDDYDATLRMLASLEVLHLQGFACTDKEEELEKDVVVVPAAHVTDEVHAPLLQDVDAIMPPSTAAVAAAEEHGEDAECVPAAVPPPTPFEAPPVSLSSFPRDICGSMRDSCGMMASLRSLPFDSMRATAIMFDSSQPEPVVPHTSRTDAAEDSATPARGPVIAAEPAAEEGMEEDLCGLEARPPHLCLGSFRSPSENELLVEEDMRRRSEERQESVEKAAQACLPLPADPPEAACKADEVLSEGGEVGGAEQSSQKRCPDCGCALSPRETLIRHLSFESANLLMERAALRQKLSQALGEVEAHKKHIAVLRGLLHRIYQDWRQEEGAVPNARPLVKERAGEDHVDEMGVPLESLPKLETHG